MGAAEHGDQQLINNFVLANDDLANFLTHSLVGGSQAADGLFFERREGGCGAVGIGDFGF